MITEQSIQTKIKDALTDAGWLVVKLIHTSMNGIPDLVCLRNGEAVFIEVKKPGGRLSALQRHIIQKLIQRRFDVIVAKSIEDINHLI